MSHSDDWKSEPQSVELTSKPVELQISQTVPESAGAPETLSQHPKAVASRAYRARVRANKAGSKRSQSGVRPLSQKPLWSADQIRDKLRRWDRAPFLDLLGAWLECAPTPEALTAFADRFPDRYATSLLSISKIAGFAERKEVTADITGSVVHKIEDMSDSGLEDYLRDLAYKIGIPMPKVLELKALEDQKKSPGGG